MTMTISPSGQQPCPGCQAQLPVYAGFPTWCDQCGWNLEPPKTPVWPPPSLIDKLHAAISRKLEPLERAVTQRVFALDEMRFRALFGLQW
jgi:predicted amidophosphoribosyltransferase